MFHYSSVIIFCVFCLIVKIGLKLIDILQLEGINLYTLKSFNYEFDGDDNLSSNNFDNNVINDAQSHYKLC